MATKEQELEEMRKKIAELEELLKAASDENDEIQSRLKQAASQQSLASFNSAANEVPTGKVVAVQRCDKYDTVGYKDDGRPILKPVYHDEELPTFYYRVDLPPSGGVGLQILGKLYVHGETYEFDLDTLRTVKEIVGRSWEHERNIRGESESEKFYHREPVKLGARR